MKEKNQLQEGMTLTLQKKVTIDDTALHYGSGKIENLFATPRLVALMIEASTQLMDPLLPENFVSVGHHVEVDHFKPSLIGATITVEITLFKIENEKYLLHMVAYDEYGQVGKGKHTRSVVNYRSLIDRAQSRERESQ
ncbi:thioesterase family protein [Fusibacter bizertensis]